MAPNNDKQYSAAAKLIGLGMDYANRPKRPANQRTKRSAAPNGGGRGVSTVTLHSHNITGNLTVVQTVVPFEQIFKEKSPGVHYYYPNSIAVAVGKLTQYSPLAARSKVRFGLSSEVEVNVTWAGARRVITTKRYTSPWMDLHVALPLSLIIYNKDPPKGEYIVECAGLVDWDAEIQNRQIAAVAFQNEQKFKELKAFQEYLDSKNDFKSAKSEVDEEDDDDEEEEDETPVKHSPSKPRALTPTLTQQLKK